LRRQQEANQNTKTTIQDEDQYFQIQITITNGKERTLRIHRNDDPYDIAANLAKIYSMKDMKRFQMLYLKESIAV
jgi:hypothetical protein